mmetsp:Transcript_30942/g.100767  ORF Transcript_30942/g.100767 Transcript_30942/m.100767 type:complete len:301 (+) Transcript_30942:94-996(+)
MRGGLGTRILARARSAEHAKDAAPTLTASAPRTAPAAPTCAPSPAPPPPPKAAATRGTPRAHEGCLRFAVVAAANAARSWSSRSRRTRCTTSRKPSMPVTSCTGVGRCRHGHSAMSWAPMPAPCRFGTRACCFFCCSCCCWLLFVPLLGCWVLVPRRTQAVAEGSHSRDATSAHWCASERSAAESAAASTAATTGTPAAAAEAATSIGVSALNLCCSRERFLDRRPPTPTPSSPVIALSSPGPAPSPPRSTNSRSCEFSWMRRTASGLASPLHESSHESRERPPSAGTSGASASNALRSG